MAYRARFRNRSSLYHKTPRLPNAYGTPQNLAKPALGVEGTPRFAANEKIDLRARDRLELLESMRGPRERDFYQDHTYHDQWEERSHSDRQMREIKARYRFMDPNFQIRPWTWHPGDIVEVVEGPGQGQRGSIIAVVPYRNQVIVQNINVKDVTLPAGDGRPEQVVQREHPIDASVTRHVDPSNGELCTLRLIQVKAKNEDGTQKYDANGLEVTETRRISMTTGTILPLPPAAANTVATGDPLRDTPYHDAVEETFEKKKEMAVLVERKLAALEEHFVKSLRAAYQSHSRYADANAKEMRHFQRAAVRSAIDKVAGDLSATAESLDDWWFRELAPIVEDIEERKAAKLAAHEASKQKAREASADAQAAAQRAAAASAASAAEEDIEFDEDDFEDSLDAEEGDAKTSK